MAVKCRGKKVTKMFELNEKVLYGTNGVCEISEITQKTIGKEKIEYYVLKPVYNPNSTVFVPTNNENLVGKMKKMMTRQQLDNLLFKASSTELDWDFDESARKEKFRNIISHGDILDLLVLLKSLWLHRRQQIEKGRKLHICDELTLKDAERIISEEIAYVIGVNQDEVVPYIKSKILIKN